MAYAAIVSLINRLNESLRFNPIELGDSASEYLVFLSHYKLDFPQDREALASIFRAANVEDFLAKNSFLERHKVYLLWERLFNFLSFRRIQNLKPSVCLVEAFLKDPPPINENDRKRIQILAHEAEDLTDLLMSNVETVSYSRMYQIEKEFQHLITRTWQYECATKCTNDFIAGYSLCSSSSQTTFPLENNLVGFDHDLIKIK